MRYSDSEAIEKLQEVTGMTFSEEQMDILNHNGGLHIVACAGSGKTTTLTLLVSKRVMTGEIDDASKLLMTTYSKGGATEMSDRINELLRAVDCNEHVEVKTMHASYYKCLARFKLIKNVVSAGQRRMFIRQAVKECKLRLEDKDLEDLDGLLSFQINNMMTDEQVYTSPNFTLDIKLEDFCNIRAGYAKKKTENNMMDFDDMQYYMYYLLCIVKNQEFIRYCKSQWKYFYVDEFQDTSKIQFAILRALADDSNNIMVIGDDDQCIYAWRGADPSIILNIGAYYDLKKFYLSTNYRCRERILRFAEAGVKHMFNREEKQMQPFKEGGNVEFAHFPDSALYEMSMYLCDKIVAEVASGVSPESIAVLMRNNVHACVLGSMLAQKGLNIRSNADMKLSNLSYFKDYENLLEMLGDNFSNQTYDKYIASNMLWKLIPFFGTNGAGIIYEIMDNTSLGLNDAIDYVLYEYFGYGKFDKNISIPKSVGFRIQTRVRRLAGDSVVGLRALSEELHKEDSKSKLLGLVALYKVGMSFTLKNPDTGRVFNCFIKYFNSILEENGVEGLRQVVSNTKQLESDKVSIMGDKVTISTVHSSKGMEWNHVYLMAFDNVSFPSFSYLSEIASRPNVRKEDVVSYIDGERRLNYVALTRAIDTLTLVGDFDNFSIFGAECLGEMDDISPEDLVRIADQKIKCGIYHYGIDDYTVLGEGHTLLKHLDPSVEKKYTDESGGHTLKDTTDVKYLTKREKSRLESKMRALAEEAEA